MQKTTTILEYPPMILKLTLEENFQPLSLEAHFISPNIEYLEIFPIPPIRVVPNVLSRDLLNPNESDPTKDKLRAGFLAIDQSRHILLITDSYSKLQNIPVVGLWISGLVTGLKDALFLQSVKSFIANQKLVKLDIGKPVILFALVDQGTLQFYEVQYHIGHSPIDLHVSQTLELGDSEMEHHVCLLLEKQDTSQNNVLCKILESELGW